MRPRGVVVAALGPLLALAGCASGAAEPPGPPERAAGPVPFAGCADLTGSPAAPASPAKPVAGSGLPELALPCFAGGSDVELAVVRGPAVINLWASWCAPCRAELPAFQRFADRHAGDVRVIGVVSMDGRDAALGLATDLGLRFPQLLDSDGRVMREVRRAALPITLFVDRDGRVRHLYNGRALDESTLDELARRHLGLVPA